MARTHQAYLPEFRRQRPPDWYWSSTVDKNRRFREPGIASISIFLRARLDCRDLLPRRASRKISFYPAVRFVCSGLLFGLGARVRGSWRSVIVLPNRLTCFEGANRDG